MDKTFEVGDKSITLRCNAFTPPLFRELSGNNKDLLYVMKDLNKKEPDFETFNLLTYTMAKQAGFEGTLEEFLSQFEMNEFYDLCGKAVEFWFENAKSKSSLKKGQGK